MLKLIRRCPEYVSGYREYCQESYDNHVIYFRPTNPKLIDNEWFSRTKDWYDKKETGQIQGQPISFHFWAVDDEKFIGEFQLRTKLTPEVMEDYEREYGLKPLGEFVREIVGLDMSAAKEAFSEFLTDAVLNSRQIYFV